MQQGTDSPVASVDRALRILTLIGGATTGLSLDELAAKLGIPKSSLHRILAALRFRKFVSQPEVGGAYFLGTELLATAFRFHDMLDLRALVHPLLVQLSAAVPIFLGRKEPAAAVSVTLLGSRAEMQRLNELGEYLRAIVADWSRVPGP